MSFVFFSMFFLSLPSKPSKPFAVRLTVNS